jgi:hypothetical protein
VHHLCWITLGVLLFCKGMTSLLLLLMMMMMLLLLLLLMLMIMTLILLLLIIFATMIGSFDGIDGDQAFNFIFAARYAFICSKTAAASEDNADAAAKR